MDASAQSGANVLNKKPNFKLKNILFPLLIFLVGIFIGYSANRFLPLQTRMIAETDLPLGVALLRNPIVYQWSGSVEGALVRKDKNSLTLSKNGHTITIPVDEGTFYSNHVASAGASPKRRVVAFDDLVIGSYLRGAFFATPQVQDKNIIRGSSFIIEKGP